MSTSTKVVTGKVRFSYLNVFEAKTINDSADRKFSASLIISKSDTGGIKKIQDAIAAAEEIGKTSKFGGKIPTGATYKKPLRDGDLERPDDAAYKNCYFVNCNAKEDRRPSVVDANRNEILDKNEVYSGCYGRASITFYAFNTGGNKGIACGLNHVQKLEEGPRLDSGSKAEDDFDDDFEDSSLI